MAGTRRDWIVGMALVAGLLGGHRLASAELEAAVSQPVSAAEAPSMRVLLRIELRNDAKFRRNAIEAAQALVSAIYAHTGIHLIWTNQDPQLTVVLKPSASAEITLRAEDGKGFTPGTDEVRGRLAFVLMNRVNKIAEGYAVSPSIVLGVAIAHELGHLLICKEHTAVGIMQSYVNQPDFRDAREGRLLFTSEQAEVIRQSARMLMVTIGLNGWTHSSAAADAPQTPAPRPTLNLELRNMTTFSPPVLAEARQTLTQIYRAAGIGVQWKTVGADFTVFVISRPPPAVRVSRFALGYVPSDNATRGRQAFVLADRIKNRSSELVVSFHLVLGLTMAHEVAHLLLPYESHSVDGLMRSVWNASDYWKARLGQLLFTDEEAQLMRVRLSAEQ